MKLTEDQSNVVDGLGWIGGHQQVMLSLCKTFSFFSRLQRLALAVIIVSVYEAKVWHLAKLASKLTCTAHTHGSQYFKLSPKLHLCYKPHFSLPNISGSPHTEFTWTTNLQISHQLHHPWPNLFIECIFWIESRKNNIEWIFTLQTLPNCSKSWEWTLNSFV